MGFCILGLKMIKMIKKSERRGGCSGYLQSVPKPMIAPNVQMYTDTKPPVGSLCDISGSEQNDS